MKTFRKILDQVSEKLSIVILAVMVVLVVWQVGARYIMKAPIPWTEQLSKYLFIWLVLINSAYIFGKKEHMAITFFKETLPAKVQKILEYAIEIITLVFALFILGWGGYQALVIGIPQTDAALNISMGYVYLALPLSGALTALYSICNLVELATEKEEKEVVVNKKEMKLKEQKGEA